MNGKFLFALLAGLAVSGCELFEGRGDVSFSIAATDVVEDPVDRIDEVVISVSKVVFVSADGERETIEFDPAEPINLLNFTRGDSAPLISNSSLPSARYDSVELTIDSDEDDDRSYVRFLDGGIAILFVPEDQQSKLRLPVDFEIEDGETTALTLQFELRRSLRRQSADRFELHPSVRIINDDDAGAIRGGVDASLLSNDCDPAIYAFTGSNATPGDIDAVSTGPVSTSAVVASSGENDFVYALEFLNAGNYTLALTCKASDEDPARSDDLDFVAINRATVEAGEVTTKDIVE